MHRGARLEGQAHRRGVDRLHAVDPDRRPLLLERGGRPRDQPPAADPDDDDVDLRQVLEDLEPDAAMAGDDGGVLERVDERQATLVADPLERPERLTDVGALEDDLGAVAAAGRDLRRIRADGHDDGHRDPGLASGPRVRLARRCRPTS